MRTENTASKQRATLLFSVKTPAIMLLMIIASGLLLSPLSMIAGFTISQNSRILSQSQLLRNRRLHVQSNTISPRIARQSTKVFASNSNQNTPRAEFELQELRAQLDAMKKAEVTAQNTRPEKRQELTNYLSAVVSRQPSPIQLKRIADNGAAVLHGKWRLAFSTNDGTLAELPFESTVFLDIQPDYL